VAPISS